MSPEYANILNAHFDRINKQCVLAFKKKKAQTSKTKGARFFYAESKCKRPQCTAKWRLVIQEECTAKQGSKVLVR